MTTHGGWRNCGIMKKIVRWHIGDPSQIGWDILKESVLRLQKLYPEFECFLHLNGSSTSFPLLFESDTNIQIVVQDSNTCSHLPIKFSAEDWKLCPPRVNLNAYEIIMDNDLVLAKRIPSIDEFLFSDRPICLEAAADHDLVRKSYGQFNQKIGQEIRLNSGLYGFPPGFDFEKKLLDLWKGIESWSSRYDEQGSVVAAISDVEHITIPATQILPLGQGATFREGLGYHFLHANKGQSSAWEGYRFASLLDDIRLTEVNEFNIDTIADLVREAGLSPYDPRRDLYGDERCFMNHSAGICQHPIELAHIIDLIIKMKYSTMIEVGSGHGWTSTFIQKVVSKFQPFEVTSIDKNPNGYKEVSEISEVNFLNMSSNEVSGAFDVAFIDADHSYKAVKNDYEKVGKASKMCVFHDIDDSCCPGVKRLWDDVKKRGLSREFICNQGKLGLGALFNLI